MKLSADVRTLLDEPNFAHLATLLPDGSPQSAPVWIDVEGDRVLIATGEGSLKARNTKRDPRVSLSIVAMDNPYREAQLRGRVVERRRAAWRDAMYSHRMSALRPFVLVVSVVAACLVGARPATAASIRGIVTVTGAVTPKKLPVTIDQYVCGTEKPGEDLVVSGQGRV